MKQVEWAWGHASGICFMLLFAVASCGDGAGPVGSGVADDGDLFCTVGQDDIVRIVDRDEIPALTNPTFVAPGSAETDYLTPESRVVGLVLNGEALAVPLGILRYHEIVNLDRGDERVAVSYSPQAGSSRTFDRTAIVGAEFGVSGLLIRNDLLLYNRGDDKPSLFAQMRGRAVCGPLGRLGLGISTVASWEMRWDAWLRLFPETRVVSRETGFERAYDINPNAEYDRIDNPDRLVSVPLDPRRPPKEPVLGIPSEGEDGPAFPFEAMKASERQVFAVRREGRSVVVFWDRAAEAATTFYTTLDGVELTFEVAAEGYRDVETGSVWRLDGLAVDGLNAGRRLEPVGAAYVAFWFAWADLHPETWLAVR
jgi:Protein of unknown function (DUF3179)